MCTTQLATFESRARKKSRCSVSEQVELLVDGEELKK